MYDALDNKCNRRRKPLLTGFCGSLATSCDLFPINYEKWPDIPDKYFNHVFVHIIKPRFYFNTTEENASRYFKGSIGKKWGTHKLKLWKEFYNPASTRDQHIDNVPTSIQAYQWATFVDYHLSQKYKEMCKRNTAEVRKVQVIPYCGSAKSYARKKQEMFLENGKSLVEEKFILKCIRQKMDCMLIKLKKFVKKSRKL